MERYASPKNPPPPEEAAAVELPDKGTAAVLPDEEPAAAPPAESPADENPDEGNAPPSRFVPPPAAPAKVLLPIPVPPPPKEMLAEATRIIALFKEKTPLVAAAAPACPGPVAGVPGASC